MYKDDISKSHAMPISQLAPDANNTKLFQITTIPESSSIDDAQACSASPTKYTHPQPDVIHYVSSEGDVDLLGSDSSCYCWIAEELPARITRWRIDTGTPHGIPCCHGYVWSRPVDRYSEHLIISLVDFVEPQERIHELSYLIASLPITNYSLLRELTAHLILIVQNSTLNKMTMRNVGIMFSPTLAIPAGVFCLMLG